jgi:hypothetical protein
VICFPATHHITGNLDFIMVAVNRNEVFISSISLTSLHVSDRAGHLQVNTIVS